jgi:hypothetical protein
MSINVRCDVIRWMDFRFGLLHQRQLHLRRTTLLDVYLLARSVANARVAHAWTCSNTWSHDN